MGDVVLREKGKRRCKPATSAKSVGVGTIVLCERCGLRWKAVPIGPFGESTLWVRRILPWPRMWDLG